MKNHHDKFVKAKKTVALVSTCAVSIEQAIKVAQSTVGGTIFDVKLKDVDQQPVWRVKLLLSGRRVKINVDGQSGRVIEAKAEMGATEASYPIAQEPAMAGSALSVESAHL